MADQYARHDAADAEIKDIDLWLAHLPHGYLRDTFEARRAALVREGRMEKEIVVRNFTHAELRRLAAHPNIGAGYIVDECHNEYTRRWQRIATRFGRLGHWIARHGPPPTTVIDRARLLEYSVIGARERVSRDTWLQLEVESQAAPEEKR